MDRTTSYRRQHSEMLNMANQMSRLLEPVSLGKDARVVRGLLSTLAGKLSVHLSMEDKSLYPNLLKSKDIRISSLAKQYVKEMGDIKEVFGAYIRNWPGPTAIQNNPIKFIEETKGIFEALQKRIDREDTELYPMVDSM